MTKPIRPTTRAQRQAQTRNFTLYKLKGMKKQLYRMELPGDATTATELGDITRAVDALIKSVTITNTSDWEAVR